ncbi:MAG TPA: PGPGW domain-containing protein [Pirellulales bacterium]
MTFVEPLFDYARSHVSLLVASVAVWIVSVVVTLWVARYYLVSIPADYFAHPHRPLAAWQGSHPARRWALLVAKNVLGAVFLAAGLVMLVTPGSGWIALLLGLYLLDIPGKRAVERRILQRPAILRLVNRVRAGAGQPPLVFELHAAAVR